MKYIGLQFLFIVLFVSATAQIRFYGSMELISMLKYTPTFGLNPSVGISSKNNALYITAAYSGRNMMRVYKLPPYTNFTKLSYMKFGIGYNRYISVSKKNKLNVGAECLINYFDFYKTKYTDTNLVYNLNVYGEKSRLLFSVQAGYNYFIKKHIAINVTCHVDFKQLTSYRRLPNSSAYVHSLFRPFFIPYVSVGIVYK